MPCMCLILSFITKRLVTDFAACGGCSSRITSIYLIDVIHVSPRHHFIRKCLSTSWHRTVLTVRPSIFLSVSVCPSVSWSWTLFWQSNPLSSTYLLFKTNTMCSRPILKIKIINSKAHMTVFNSIPQRNKREFVK